MLDTQQGFMVSDHCERFVEIVSPLLNAGYDGKKLSLGHTVISLSWDKTTRVVLNDFVDRFSISSFLFSQFDL